MVSPVLKHQASQMHENAHCAWCLPQHQCHSINATASMPQHQYCHSHSFGLVNCTGLRTVVVNYHYNLYPKPVLA